jgi:hypothetical protein
MVAVSEAVEPLLRQQAKERKREGGRSGGQAWGNLPQASENGRARYHVARYCGVDRKTCEAALGEMLGQTVFDKGGGDHRSPRATGAPTLSEIGVNKSQSSRWQLIAANVEIYEPAAAASTAHRARADLDEEGRILDGRCRAIACDRLGIELKTQTVVTDDPLGHVVSANLRRRHLDESQRAMVAARVATLKQGRPSKTGEFAALPTQEEAASMLNVGERSLRDARVVIKKGTPELVDMVDCGELAVSGAAAIAKLPAEEQEELVARGKVEILAKAKEIRAERQKQKRTKRRRHLNASQRAMIAAELGEGFFFRQTPRVGRGVFRRAAQRNSAKLRYFRCSSRDVVERQRTLRRDRQGDGRGVPVPGSGARAGAAKRCR